MEKGPAVQIDTGPDSAFVAASSSTPNSILRTQHSAPDPSGSPLSALHSPHSALGLLHYRAWRGKARGSAWSVWPIARTALQMMFRRKLFWAMYALALLFFLIFFFGQYLLAWAESQMGEQVVPLGLGIKGDRDWFTKFVRQSMGIDGSARTYRTFFWWQGYMVMVVLAMAGSVLVGNDFRFGSLPFYLSKPLGRWHYLAGKGLAIAVFINLMTTLPALILFGQYGLLTSWEYFWNEALLLGGILAYGLLLTVCLSILLLATACWLRRTVPLIMAWTTLFVFLPRLAAAMVDGLHYDPRWRLFDLWNDMYLLGNALLGMSPDSIRPAAQPETFEAALVLTGMCLLCLLYLNRRIRAVEVVSG